MMYFRKKLFIALTLVTLQLLPSVHLQGQITIIEALRLTVKRVIKAVDLKIQRLQNRTIWLQNTQKALENALSKLRLQEISSWSAKQTEQYRRYYQDLQKVRSVIAQYKQVREIARRQMQVLQEYQRVWSLLRTGGNFSAGEIDHMQQVYAGILRESLENVEQFALLLSSYTLQMDDAQRLKLIGELWESFEQNFQDLKKFNAQNLLLRVQRQRDRKETEGLKLLFNNQSR